MISRLTLNLECVFRIECQQVQGHHEIIRVFLGGLASKLELVIAMEHRTSSRSSQGHQDIYYWIGLKLRTCDRVWGPNKFKVIPMSFRHLLLDWFQTSYMLSKLTAKHVQGHLNVIWAFITGLASNLVHAIAIEGRTRSMSSQGHLGIYYWIGFKLSTCYHNWQPNMYKVISRSFEHLLLD